MYSVGSGGRGSCVNSSQQAKSFLSFHPSLLVFLGEVNLHVHNPSNTCSQIMGILTVNDLFLHSTQQPTSISHIDLYSEIFTSVIQLWLHASNSSSTSSHRPPNTHDSCLIEIYNPLFSPLSTVTHPISSQLANLYSSLLCLSKQNCFSGTNTAPLTRCGLPPICTSVVPWIPPIVN